MSSYLHFPGAEGTVTAHGHEQWVELEQFSYQSCRQVSRQSGQAIRNANSPEYSTLTFVKKHDTSSGQLIAYFNSGKVISKIEIHCCKNQKSTDNHFEVVFNNALVSSYQHIYTPKGLVDYFQIAYSCVQETHKEHDEKNVTCSSFSTGYDICTAKSL